MSAAEKPCREIYKKKSPAHKRAQGSLVRGVGKGWLVAITSAAVSTARVATGV